jgi:hypothetical protein
MEDFLTELRAIEWWRCGDEELLERLGELERASRTLSAVMARVITETDARGLAGEFGYGNLPELLRDLLVITRADAKRRVERARQVAELPLVSEAADAGVLHPDHVAMIADTMAAIPEWASDEDRARTASILVEAAGSVDAWAIRRLGRSILVRLDQDGAPPNDAELAESKFAGPANEFRYAVKRSGRVAFSGEVDPETGAILTGAISALAVPQPLDVRTVAERHGDAFADLVRLVADAGSLPEEGGQKPHVTVTVSLDALREGVGTATLGDTALLTASEARRIACDSGIVPMVLGSRSEPLDIGRETRTIPAAIRKALVHRDGGCTFPGCDRPPQWTDAHHITAWADGGPTALSNLTLLCRQHHSLIHHSRWHIDMDSGTPMFIPPKFIDREQRPRVNLLRQPNRAA